MPFDPPPPVISFSRQVAPIFAFHCNGCHGAETSTGFLHVQNRQAGQVAGLSGFMTGIDVSDPVSQQSRHFSDLERRAADFGGLICAVRDAAFLRGPKPARVH